MCEVCCEVFNLSTHKRVTCPYCPFEACSTCVEKYILESASDPHCMACRKGWSREILHGLMSCKFVNKTLKARREEILFERERSLMPATQPYVEAEKRTRTFQNLIIRARSQIGELRREQNAIHSTEVQSIDDRIERARKAYDIEKRVKGLDTDIEFWGHCMLVYARGSAAEPVRRQFVRACPFDGCAGFLSTAWKCGLCENWACPECHEVRGPDKDAPHTCDPNNVATARLLEKDSRPCPKCASVIFKIDGCDQMFCTRCHTAFSWRRGVIETGRVHNPHYYEYMRANGNLPREPGDAPMPCGGMPNWTRVLQLLPQSSCMGTIHRMHGHVLHVVMARYRTDAIEDNRDLRIKFMLKDFTDEIFKRKLQQREKARQKKTEIMQILEMYQAVTVDLFQSFVANKDVQMAQEAFTRLRDHVNEELRAVSRRYTNCAVPTINDNFVVY